MTTTLGAFNIIGISVRTINRDHQSAKDIGALWSRFYSDNMFQQIPGALSSDIYSVYTDYESDYRGWYTCIIGLRVADLNNIPAGLAGRHFDAEDFTVFIAKGLLSLTVINTWEKIWNDDAVLNRKYTYDVEVYGENSQQGDASEVPIYIATKK